METIDFILPQSAPLTAPSKEGALASLPLLRVAERPSGNELTAGGSQEPRGT